MAKRESSIKSDRWRIIRSVSLFLVGPVFGFVIFLIVNKWRFDIAEGHTAELIWALIAYMFAEHLARMVDRGISEREATLERKEVKEEINETAELFRADLQSSLRISQLSDDAFFERVDYSLRSAFHVKNTFVGISELTGFRSPNGTRIINMYRDVLSKDGATTWQDIVGVKELFDRRFLNINANNDQGFLGTHLLHVIDTHDPILNFVLIGPKDSAPTEVYFGWILGSGADIERFHSTDGRLIRMFDNYFSSLCNSRNVVARVNVPYFGAADQRFAASIPHRWQGHWISISGAVKALPADGLAPDRDKHEISEFAIVSIAYDHEWKVSGTVYDMNMKKKYSFDSGMCSVVGNSLYYKFQNKSPYGEVQSEGLGSYSMAGDSDSLLGHYARKPYNKAAVTRAIKISNAIEKLIRAGDPAAKNHVDSSIKAILAAPIT